jgi:hypothetical protein
MRSFSVTIAAFCSVV